MRTTTATLLAFALLLGACGDAGSDPTGDEQTEGTAPSDWTRSEAFIGDAQVLILESFPIQIRLSVTGDLPTPCHIPVWEVEDDGATIAVTLESAADPDEACTQVLEPFEVTIDLGSFSEGSRTVTLNGETVGEFSA